MESDEKVKESLRAIDEATIQKVCDILRSYDTQTSEYLARIVASVCSCDESKILHDTSNLNNSHARWLYWYAYRYMTNDSYKSIAMKSNDSRKFTESCVGICVAKMSMMIESEPIWKKRWIIVKRVIKAILNNEECEQAKTLTLKVISPKGVNVELLNEK